MRVQTLIEFIDAAVDTKLVSGPYEERGGIMLVGYPGSLKSSILQAAMSNHIDAMVLSDINVQQFLKMREDFVTERFTAIGFTDYEKIYQRHSFTASHVEGIVKGLVCEGYGLGPNSDQRMPYIPARALVVGCMTNACLEQKYEEWQKSGFLRRFIWLMISLANIQEISHAIRRWEKIDFGKILYRTANKSIAPKLSPKREQQIFSMMQQQAGANGTALVLLKKIATILDWRYENQTEGAEHVTKMLDELRPALSKNGGKIVL